MTTEYRPENILKQMYYLRELWFLKEESKQKLDLIYLYYLRKEDGRTSFLPDKLDMAIRKNLEEQMKANVSIMSNVMAYKVDCDNFRKRLQEYSKSVKPIDISIFFQEENEEDKILFSTKMYLYSPDSIIWSAIWPKDVLQTTFKIFRQEKEMLNLFINSVTDIKLLSTIK